MPGSEARSGGRTEPSRISITGMQLLKHAVVRYVNYFLGAFEALLAARLVLRLLGASPQAAIVNGIYRLTDIIIGPFAGIFSNVNFGNGSIFDVVAVSAMIGYPILVYLIMELIHLIAKEPGERPA